MQSFLANQVISNDLLLNGVHLTISGNQLYLNGTVLSGSSGAANTGTPNIFAGNSLFVDIVNGLNSGSRGISNNSFNSLSGSLKSAISGDTIYVRPGNYNGINISKNGVNWKIDGNITCNLTSTNNAVFDDSTSTGQKIPSDAFSSPMIYNVECLDVINSSPLAGSTSFSYGSVISLVNSKSNVYAKTRDLINLYDDAAQNGVVVSCGALGTSGGTLNLTARNIIGTYPIWWAGGDMHIKADNIQSTVSQASYSGVPYGAINTYAVTNSTPVGKLWVEADSIIGGNGPAIITTYPGTPVSQTWITAKEIISSVMAVICEGGKLYINAQKISTTGTSIDPQWGQLPFGIVVGDGLNWITVEKIAGPMLNIQGGSIVLNCLDWDDNLGSTDYFIQSLFGPNNCTILGGHFVGKTSNGLIINDGTVRLKNVTLDFSAVSGSNPITINGGSLILEGCTLISYSGQSCITSTSSQNVLAMGCYANTSINSNITISIPGGLIVNSGIK